MDLINGERMHAKHPATFEIPSHDDRMNLTPGDLVKIGLRDGADGERFWVMVTDAERGGPYSGTVNNHLTVFDLPFGASIAFGPEHVLSVDRVNSPAAA